VLFRAIQVGSRQLLEPDIVLAKKKKKTGPRVMWIELPHFAPVLCLDRQNVFLSSYAFVCAVLSTVHCQQQEKQCWKHALHISIHLYKKRSRKASKTEPSIYVI